MSETDVEVEARRAIEAVLMVTEEPVSAQLLAQLIELPPERIEAICADLAAGYEAEQRGFRLARVAGGYRYHSHEDLAPYVERFVLHGQSSRLSAAALETLAIIAYKQPLSRAQVAAIRGVNVDAVVRTLAQRGYIAEVGRDPGPGQAVLYGTTDAFLEKLGLDSVDELPPLGDFVPSAEVVEALEHGLSLAEPDDAPAADTEVAGSTAVGGEVGPTEDGAEAPVVDDGANGSGPA